MQLYILLIKMTILIKKNLNNKNKKFYHAVLPPSIEMTEPFK